MYRKGFWLILIESDGSELAVACQILSRDNETLRLRAHVPPTWYPQSFTSYKVRQNGEILGWRRLPADAPIQVPAHAGLYSVDLDFQLDAAHRGLSAGDRHAVVSAPGA
jgi:hypothetical protein